MTPGSILGTAAIASAFVALVLFVAFLHSARNRRFLSATVSGLAMLCAGLLAALSGLIVVGTRGYQALTLEESAAYVWTVPVDEEAFVAHFRFPDGDVQTFRLQGDELYVDAHILKWKPIVNILGLHTAYELDRVAGRYGELEDERTRERTVYSLAAPKPFDLFALRRSSMLLAPLLDAEYGSATFIAAPRDTAAWELLVSTSGLLIRPASVAASERP